MEGMQGEGNSQIDTIKMEGFSYDSLTADLLSVPCCLVLEERKQLSCNEASIIKEIMEKLLDVYHIYCEKHLNGELEQYIDAFDNLPSLIFELVPNGDFEDSRLLNLEILIVKRLFPPSFSTMDVTYHWIKIIPHLSSSQIRDVEYILSEKRRLQKEMKDYMKLREKAQEEILNKIVDDHRFHDFLDILLLRCSNSIFSYKHVARILHVLDYRLVRNLDRDHFEDMSTYDVSCAIDLLSIKMEGFSYDSLTADLLSVPCCLVLEERKQLSCNEASIIKEIMEKLLDVYHIYCEKHLNGELEQYIDAFDNLPSLIFELVPNGDFEDSRLLNLEILIVKRLFPPSFSTMDVTYHWIKIIPHLSSSQIRDVEYILSEKRRLQKEMKDYMKLREKAQNTFSEDIKEKIQDSFQKLSTFFMDPIEAIRCFQKLHDMNDKFIFRCISRLLSRHLESGVGKIYREEILNKIVDDHRFHDFLDILLLRCSNSIFSYKHVARILHVLDYRLVRNLDRDHFEDMSTYDVSCAIDLLSMILNVYPNLLNGNKKKFLKLFSTKAGCSTVKLLQMLSSVGHRLPIELSDIYPLLLKMHREGSPVETYHIFRAMASFCSAVDESKRRKVVPCSGTVQHKSLLQHDGVRSCQSKVPSALEN